MLEVVREDYVRTARAKGLSNRLVIALHALPNALLPVVTLSGILLGFVLAGSIPVERAFGTLEAALCETGPWILGARPTLADISLMPFAARLDHLGLLDLWIANRPRVKDWWSLASEWPSFKRGLRDLISEVELAEMQTHGPKIANDVAKIVADVRRNMAPEAR